MNYTISELQAFLAQCYPGKKLSVLPYGYTATFTGLAQATSQSSVIPIQANGDFVLLSIRHRANIAAAQSVSTKTAPFIRLLITDSGTAQQLTAQAVDLENFSTNDAKPNPLPWPRILSGKSSQNIAVTNYAPTAETYAVDIFLSGVLVQQY